ncbi:synaptobrevin-domain-containing protein [Catenaria anguillulae PL171]|uniref:Synaptobrevin-domain-containing protein n=1 Tax=Catenaria anguillulae PL171 TaxID=765915 RepID=A0A1Y2H512_9FUNG|nr:synaptobrevin-domain-containing protein [Catenaria anguillulae PL171]
MAPPKSAASPVSPTKVPLPASPVKGHESGRPDMNKAKNVQAQINEVTDIMHNNIGKVIERGEKMQVLAEKTENLQNAANLFKTNAQKVHKEVWLKELKLKIAIGCVLLIGVMILLFPVINNLRAVTGGGSSSPPTLTTSDTKPANSTTDATSSMGSRSLGIIP